MAARPVLIVLIVRDAGLRAALAARLSTDGLELLSADGWDDAMNDRLVRRPAVLVIDSAAAAGLPEDWIEAKLAANMFERAVVLRESGPAPSNRDDRLMQISASAAIDFLSQLFADYYDPDQSAPSQIA